MNRITRRGISCGVPVIPPQPPVTIWIDGRRLQQYIHAYVAGGRVYAPVSPLLRRLADAVWWEGSTLVVRRCDRQLRVKIPNGNWASLQTSFVPIAPMVQFLGDAVTYDARTHEVDVRTAPARPLETPTPYAPVQQIPQPVFTPVASPTPKPVWSGSPLPRRTPLPSNGSPPKVTP
ncbi:MAG TPA: hypothetical protein VGK84_11465 [Candidatus Tumulicola sp.]